jgi:hypothetical protein
MLFSSWTVFCYSDISHQPTNRQRKDFKMKDKLILWIMIQDIVKSILDWLWWHASIIPALRR